MAKSNIFSKIFGREAKKRKLISNLKKQKKEYDKLDKKLINGTINNSELKKYYSLKEEIKKMADKFVFKNGQLVMKDDEKENSKMNEQTTNKNQKVGDSVQQPPQKMSEDNNKNVQEAIKKRMDEMKTKQKMESQMKQQVAQQQASQQQAAQQRAMQERMKQQQVAQQQAAQQQAAQQQAAQQRVMQERMKQQQAVQQQAAQQRAMQERMKKQQVAQKPIQSDKPNIKDDKLLIALFVQDLPILKVKIRKNDIEKFYEDLNSKVKSNEIFSFGTFNIIPSKIIGFKIE